MARHPRLERISVDPKGCFGKPWIRENRIWVSLIIDNLAAGASAAEIIEAYPRLTHEDIGAALAWAAAPTIACGAP